MSVLELGLSVVGMPAKTIADVKRGMPTLTAIVDEAKELEPILDQMRPHVEAMWPHLQALMPHVQALMPLLAKAAPVAGKMWPQVMEETPLAQELVAFVRSKLSDGA